MESQQSTTTGFEGIVDWIRGRVRRVDEAPTVEDRWDQLKGRCAPKDAADRLAAHPSRGVVDEDALAVTPPAVRFAKRRFRRYSGQVWRDYCAERDFFTAAWPCSSNRIMVWPNRDALLDEWRTRDRTNDVGYGGAPVYVWKEAHLVGIALQFSRQITRSRVWSESDEAEYDARRRGLDQSIASIRLRAHRIWRLHANAAPGLAGDPGAQSSAAAVWAALVDEVAELGDLAAAAKTIDELRDRQATLPHASGRLDQDERQIYVDAARLELPGLPLVPLDELQNELSAHLTELHESRRSKWVR